MSESPEIVVTSLSESTKSRIIDTSLSDNLNEKAADAPDTRDASTSQNVGGRHTMASSEKEVNPLDKSSSTSKQNADASAEKEVYNFDEIRPLSNTRDGTLSSVSGFPNLYNGADAPEVVVNVPNSSSENPQSMEHSTEKEAASDHAGSPLNKPNRLQASPGDNDRPPQYSSNAPDQDSTFAGCRSIQPDNEEDINRANKRLAEAQRVMPRVNTEWNSSFWACCSPCGLGCESLSCPCILAGRTHGRLQNFDPASQTSTNAYCLSCCLLILPIIAGAPVYWIMTMANRREIRYRYGIEGSNCEDCWKTAFCPCCALVQEEKETIMRQNWTSDEERLMRDQSMRENGGYARREDGMVYARGK